MSISFPTANPLDSKDKEINTQRVNVSVGYNDPMSHSVRLRRFHVVEALQIN